MHVSRLALTDFRSYRAVELELESGITAFVGPNGQGKTNLIEAIGYVAAQSSHRVAQDAPLVRSGATRAVVRCAITRRDRSALIELEIVPGGSNRARLNRAALPRAREALGVLRTVLFAPEDLSLVKGDPDGRRRFLDDLLVVRTPRLAGVRSDYERVLRQRNALLKSAGAAFRAGRADLRTLEVWDSHLASYGAQLLAARIALVDALAPQVAAAYQQVSDDGGPASVRYRSSLQDQDPPPGTDPTPPDLRHADLLQEQLLAALERVRRAELERGVSLVGPHRDDLVLTLRELPARGYASHGESWSFALALRLAAYRLMCADDPDGGEPVLILDDVFAELDNRRRGRLAELVADAEQVLITAAVADDVPAALSGTRLDVLDGTVTRAR